MSAYVYEYPLSELSPEFKRLLEIRLTAFLDHLDESAVRTRIESRKQTSASEVFTKQLSEFCAAGKARSVRAEQAPKLEPAAVILMPRLSNAQKVFNRLTLVKSALLSPVGRPAPNFPAA